MVKSLFFILINLIIGIPICAQIVIDDSKNISDIVKMLEGPGVSISNITSYVSIGGQSWTGDYYNLGAAGYFTDEFGVIGMNKGLILTSGAARFAVGPNDMPNKTLIHGDTLQDPDLLQLIDSTRDGDMADVCYVEFDIVTSFPQLSFNYVFASEEYIEFLEYNDVFGFFISGPGITGKKNIALIPNTDIPVSVGSINPFTSYSQYYISNGTGSTPYLNSDLQYDGYTKVLKAETSVIPCQTYHVKLAIADLLDNTYDAAVFLEQGSFKSEDLDLKISYEYPRFQKAIEGCNHARVIFTRSIFSDTSGAITYKFLINGNAVNGIDYSLISDSIVIPAGENSAYITIDPIADGIPDDGETVRLIIQNQCNAFPSPDSIEINIAEYFPYNIPSEKICLNQSVTLNKSFIPGDSIFWTPSSYLSCDTCISPLASAPASVWLPYLAKDTASGCIAKDSVFLNVIDLKADFSFQQDPCYTNLDFFFVNNSQNATAYSWDFGDNTTSPEANPVHQFPFLNIKDPISYNVTLTVSREDPGCSADTIIPININNPLFIPNLITADGDGKNDSLQVLGIVAECWKLSVYNRWESLVYSNENYKNNFTGEGLQSGIYYFHLENHRKDRGFKGWLHIIK
jgi:hypothetical protein